MRFLLWLVVLFWAVVLLRRAVAWMLRGFVNSLAQKANAQATKQQPALSSRRLVRDPVCGVHVTEERAFSLQAASGTVHFCSAACRDQYVGCERKFAANG
jgi:YHS domain-containing protein